MTNLDSILKKQRHYFANKGPYSQSYGFSSSYVWLWELDHKEDWAPKNWCFWTWCWRRLLGVPWTAKRSNQSILKEISPEYSLKGLMLKLKLQYFGHPMWRADSLEKTLMLGKIAGGEGDDGGWDGCMASLTQWTGVWASSGSWWSSGKSGMLQSMGSQRVGHDWATEQQQEKMMLPIKSYDNTFMAFRIWIFYWPRDFLDTYVISILQLCSCAFLSRNNISFQSWIML